MKKVENWLIVPVVILYALSFVLDDNTLDFHIHDTYFVLNGVSIFRILAGFLLLIFGLYKTIRHRHKTINKIFALPHIILTVLAVGVLLFPFPFSEKRQFIDYNTWTSYQNEWRWNAVAGFLFLVFQVIFLVYFIVQLIKKPVIQR